MNVLKKLSVTLSANLNALIAKVEDPVATLEKLVEDMAEDYAAAKAQVARAIADEKKLTQKHEKAQNAAAEWGRKAELAVEKDDDTLAKEALRRQKEQTQLAEVFSAELASQREGTAALKSSLKALAAKMDEAKRKKNILAAKHQRAKASARLQQTMSGIGSGRKSALEMFNKTEEKIEDLEARVAAAKELDGNNDDVEAQFAHLEHDDGMDEELAALKEKMKKDK